MVPRIKHGSSSSTLAVNYKMTITNTVPIHVRLPETLYSAAKLKAKEDDRTISYVVRQALQAYLLDADNYDGDSQS